MSDLFESAEIFEASARLQGAAICLSKLAKNVGEGSDCKFHLKWVGAFLGQLESPHIASASSAGENLAVQATTARPTYYASLLRIRHHLEVAGLNTPDSVAKFLKSLFSFLEAGGQGGQIRPEELQLGADFLRQLSADLLAQLDRNGLPTNYPFIVPELAYHGTAT
jgi:hypothetical protein